MSWFTYKTLCSTEQKIGTWLRAQEISNPELLKKIKKVGRVGWWEIIWRLEIIDVVHGKVCIQVWSHNFFKMLFNAYFIKNSPLKSTVFNIWLYEDPDWICEGDLGKWTE